MLGGVPEAGDVAEELLDIEELESWQIPFCEIEMNKIIICRK